MPSRPLPFATRLFLVLFLLSAVPSLALLGLATWGLRNYVELAGAGGAWQGVGETGRELLDALEEGGAPDSLLQATAEQHENELSRSMRLARRWDLIARRLWAALPWIALVLGLSLGVVAAWAARQLSRGLSRPVNEVVVWAGRLAREEPLPPPGSGERGAPEFSVLRDAFRHMAERLAEGRRQALEAERLRGLTDMARSAAHEIKNPLTPLVLAVRQARHLISRGKTEALGEPLGVIEHEAGRLDEMARSFSQLGRLPEGPASEIDLPELLATLLRSDLPDSVAHTLQVANGVPRVEAHLEALNRAFRNLLGNAVEAIAQREEGRIDVTIRPADGMVEIAIADNGPGVPEQDREHVWDPDFTTKRKGTGLGLALVRQTVRAYGGEVELRGTDEGACFVVRLPAAQKEPR